MSRLIRFSMSAVTVASAVCALPQVTIAQQPVQGPKPVTRRLKQELQNEVRIIQSPVEQRVQQIRDLTLVNDLDVRTINLGKYWIGLNCTPVSAALRSHLKLSDGQGLLVMSTPNAGPAHEAGLQEHDVVVKAGGEPVGSVEELIKAVQEAETSDLSLEILRAGKATTVIVKPAERPADQQNLVVGLPQISGHTRFLQYPQQGFTVFQPGVVVDRPLYALKPMPVRPTFPKGLSITITRRNDDPAEIHVEFNAKKYDIKDSEIDQLPKEIRSHVKSLLNPVPRTIYVPQANAWHQSTVRGHPLQVIPATPVAPGKTQPAPKYVETEIQKLRRELAEELKRLHQKIDELKKSAGEKTDN